MPTARHHHFTFPHSFVCPQEFSLFAHANLRCFLARKPKEWSMKLPAIDSLVKCEGRKNVSLAVFSANIDR